MHSHKVVLITGASEGIGEEMARRFYAHGYKVAMLARREELLKSIAKDWDKERFLIESMDVRDYASFKKFLDRITERWGQVNILINNAGVHKRGAVEEVSTDDIQLMVEVNLIAPLVLSRLVLPFFQKTGGGHIINIASLAGRVPVKDSATYSATKFGLRAFSYALEEEMKERGGNIHCSVISPGPIDTGFIMSQIDKVADIVFSQPISTIEEVVDMVMKTAKDQKMERNSGGLKTKILTNVGYVFPGIRRKLQPFLIKKGKRVKRKLLLRKNK